MILYTPDRDLTPPENNTDSTNEAEISRLWDEYYYYLDLIQKDKIREKAISRLMDYIIKQIKNLEKQ